MNADLLLQVNEVTKIFSRSLKRSLWFGLTDIGRELLGSRRSRTTLRPSEFWAVQSLSFALRRGECLGLIGKNGAGKSTLLKMISGLIKPDAGEIHVRGRVGALIELGAGFNPLLTGRENIYVNAALHGLSEQQVDRRLANILEFADIGASIDAPVRSYSSGMRVRLGFAIAAQLEPDLLIIDEVLAVGDIGFRAKCYNRIAHLVSRTAVIFVSHSMPQIARLAGRTLVIDAGQQVFLGPTPDAINHYYRLFAPIETTRAGTGQALIESLCFRNATGKETMTFSFAEPVTIELWVKARHEIPALVVDVNFQTVAGELIAQCNNFVKPHPIALRANQRTRIRMHIDALTLNPGLHRVNALLMSEDMTVHFDWLQSAMTIEVEGGRPASAGQQFQPRIDVEFASEPGGSG